MLYEVITGGRRVSCEVVGFRGGSALLMAFTALDGVGLGCRAEIAETQPVIYPHVITSYSIHYTKLYDAISRQPEAVN